MKEGAAPHMKYFAAQSMKYPEPCGPGYLSAEDDFSTFFVHENRTALGISALQYRHAERVKDIVLDGAFERAGTVDGVVTVLGHQGGGSIAELHLETAGQDKGDSVYMHRDNIQPERNVH